MRRLWFTHWPLRAQVLIGSVLPIGALLVVIIASAVSVQRGQDTATRIQANYALLDRASTVLRLVVDLETGVRGYALVRDTSFLTPYTQASDQIRSELAALEGDLAGRPVQQSRIRRVGALIDEWQTTVGVETIRRADAGAGPTALTLQESGRQRIDEIRRLLGEFSNEERVTLAGLLAEDDANRGWISTLSTLALAVAVVAFLITYFAISQVVEPIRDLATAAGKVAEGDFSTRLPIEGHNEIATLASSFNAMLAGLTDARDDMIDQQAALREQATIAESARFEAERARTQVRAILDATSEGIVLISPDGLFVAVNDRFTDLFGFGGGQLIGATVAGVTDDLTAAFADPDLVARYFATPASNDTPFIVPIRQIAPVPREIELYSTPVKSDDGHRVGRLFTFRDVTREREVDRMKTEFVSMVSHELRTPLTSIKGYVDLLIDEEAGPVTEDQRDFLTVVQNNADRLVALINDLLDISRIEAGRVELRTEPLDLPAILAGVAHSFRIQIANKQQRIALDIAPGLPAVVGDTNRVTQIVTNLVSNAHKYTPAGGSIHISARSIDDAVRDRRPGQRHRPDRRRAASAVQPVLPCQ